MSLQFSRGSAYQSSSPSFALRSAAAGWLETAPDDVDGAETMPLAPEELALAVDWLDSTDADVEADAWCRSLDREIHAGRARRPQHEADGARAQMTADDIALALETCRAALSWLQGHDARTVVRTLARMSFDA